MEQSQHDGTASVPDDRLDVPGKPMPHCPEVALLCVSNAQVVCEL